MKKLILVVLVAFPCYVFSQVDTVSIYSNAMHKAYNCVVIRPTELKNARFPVVYLLHGYRGAYNNWIKKDPELQQYANLYQLIIVCPDGGFSSWYFDSPVDSSSKYETYISKEVPDYIDSHYATINNRYGRAITGLSMGGHGGLFLGFRHQDRFGACGSMSGGVDINALRTKFDIAKRVGDTITHQQDWKNYSVINLIDLYPKDSLAITIDCGTEDFMYASNHQLHEKMLKLHIPHEYTERPGTHDWAYWTNSIKYQLLFFRDYFAKYINH